MYNRFLTGNNVRKVINKRRSIFDYCIVKFDNTKDKRENETRVICELLLPSAV